VIPLDEQEARELSDIERVSAIEDPKERARAVNALIDEYQVTMGELSRLRRETLEDLLAAGMTQTHIADLLGMSRSRISQLLTAGVRPERAFLGTARLTVAIGAKREADKATEPSEMVSAEAFTAYEILGEAARGVGLDVVQEVVPAPGFVHLNRPNLIVLTNPRLLPFLSQVMEADPHLRYLHDDVSGWYLSDQTTGTEYRSPRDNGERSDYGYVGRLPRPDGKGTFLYLAGTHAQGTLGAAQYVAANLGDLYKELKTRRFSTIIEAKFGEDRLKLTEVQRVTPLYRHEG
jgi:hypothetical protein